MENGIASLDVATQIAGRFDLVFFSFCLICISSVDLVFFFTCPVISLAETKHFERVLLLGLHCNTIMFALRDALVYYGEMGVQQFCNNFAFHHFWLLLDVFFDFTLSIRPGVVSVSNSLFFSTVRSLFIQTPLFMRAGYRAQAVSGLLP